MNFVQQNEDMFLKIEQIVQLDEGNRGIKEIIPQTPQLQTAGTSLCNATSLVILTGFPCLLDYNPPTETDGILGSFAIAKAFNSRNEQCKTKILTDDANKQVLEKCLEIIKFKNVTIETFPIKSEWTSQNEERLKQIASETDCIVAIERPGPSHDGIYKTMRKFNMEKFIAPLENILQYKSQSTRFIGIGDGGNELGMGSVYQQIINSKILNAKEIACVIPSDHTIVCSVSDWGGYALAAAIFQVFRQNCKQSQTQEPQIADFLFDDSEVLQIINQEILAGARDGITKQQEAFVDGMPIQISIDKLNAIKQILSQ